MGLGQPPPQSAAPVVMNVAGGLRVEAFLGVEFRGYLADIRVAEVSPSNHGLAARGQLHRLHGLVANAAERLGDRHGSSSILRTPTVVDGFIIPETRPVARQGRNVKRRSTPSHIHSKMSPNSCVSAVLPCPW